MEMTASPNCPRVSKPVPLTALPIARVVRRWVAIAGREFVGGLARKPQWSLQFLPSERGSSSRQRDGGELEQHGELRVRRLLLKAFPDPTGEHLRPA